MFHDGRATETADVVSIPSTGAAVGGSATSPDPGTVSQRRERDNGSFHVEGLENATVFIAPFAQNRTHLNEQGSVWRRAVDLDRARIAERLIRQGLQ